MLGYLSADVMFRTPRVYSSKLLENCELRVIDNVQEQMFAPNGGYYVYYPSGGFENWEYSRKLQNSFSWEIFSHVIRLDQSRANAKYLIDHKWTCLNEFGAMLVLIIKIINMKITKCDQLSVMQTNFQSATYTVKIASSILNCTLYLWNLTYFKVIP